MCKDLEEMPQNGCGFQKNRQNPGTEQQKIEAPAQQHPQKHVKPQLAPPRIEGVEEQRRQGQKAKQQIQWRLVEGKDPAQGPQQIVHQGQAEPQNHRQKHLAALEGDRKLHQCSRREKKPPGLCRSS